MGADEKAPRRWRFTLGQMMMAILCAAIVLAELVSREGYLLPTVVFFLLAYLLAWVIIYAPIKELLFGEGGKGAGSDAGEDEDEAKGAWADDAEASSFEECLREGCTLADMARYFEAAEHLEIAWSLRPGDPEVAIVLGLCSISTDRLDRAIDVLEVARRHHPDHAAVRYDLACCWSLNGDASRAVEELAAAIDRDAKYRATSARDPDFDPIRGCPEFARLVADVAPDPGGE